MGNSSSSIKGGGVDVIKGEGEGEIEKKEVIEEYYQYEKIELELSERVVDQQSLEKVECSICGDIQKEPLQCLEGHSHCASCINEWRKKKNTCPTCRSILPLQLSRNRFIESYIQDLPVHCIYHFKLDVHTQRWEKDPFEGCPFTGKMDVVKQHENHYCEHRPTICDKSKKLSLCGWIKRKDLESHLNHHCIFKGDPPINCKACASTISNWIHYHNDKCHRAKVQCEYCQESMERYQLEQHHSSICQEILEPCPFGLKICDQYIKRSEMDRHLLNNMKKHNEMLLKECKKQEIMIIDQDLKIDMLVSEMERLNTQNNNANQNNQQVAG